jgi:hypothetical protein
VNVGEQVGVCVTLVVNDDILEDVGVSVSEGDVVHVVVKVKDTVGDEVGDSEHDCDSDVVRVADCVTVRLGVWVGVNDNVDIFVWVSDGVILDEIEKEDVWVGEKEDDCVGEHDGEQDGVEEWDSVIVEEYVDEGVNVGVTVDVDVEDKVNVGVSVAVRVVEGVVVSEDVRVVLGETDWVEELDGVDDCVFEWVGDIVRDNDNVSEFDEVKLGVNDGVHVGVEEGVLDEDMV